MYLFHQHHSIPDTREGVKSLPGPLFRGGLGEAVSICCPQGRFPRSSSCRVRLTLNLTRQRCDQDSLPDVQACWCDWRLVGATWVNRPSLIFPISIVATPPFRVLRPKTLASSRAPCVPLHTGAVKKYQLCLPRWTQNPSTFYPGLLSITSHLPARSLVSVLPPQGVGLQDRIQDV